MFEGKQLCLLGRFLLRTLLERGGEQSNSIVIASAAAVASSSRDALAISLPERSETIVWKFRSASKRPCEISAWYGGYAVYQPGFSRMFLLITDGTSAG